MIPVTGCCYRLLNPAGEIVTIVDYTPGMTHAEVEAETARFVPVAWLLPIDDINKPERIQDGYTWEGRQHWCPEPDGWDDCDHWQVHDLQRPYPPQVTS